MSGSTYTSALLLELQRTGRNAGTWGDKTNVNLQKLLSAVTSVAVVSTNGGPYTLSVSGGAVDEGSAMGFIVTGAPSIPVSVISPYSPKLYLVDNRLSGQTLEVRGTIGGFQVGPGISWVRTSAGTAKRAAPQNFGSALFNGAVSVSGALTTAGNLTVGGAVSAAAGVFTGTLGVGGNVGVSAALSLGGDLAVNGKFFLTTPLSVSAGNDVVTGNANTVIVQAGASLTGLTSGADGRRLTLVNRTGSQLFILDNDSGSVASNRINTGVAAAVTIDSSVAFDMQYSQALGRWNVVGLPRLTGPVGPPGSGGVLAEDDGMPVNVSVRTYINAADSLAATDNPGNDSVDIRLVGDVASPGNNKVYGTNNSGVRGWQDAPSSPGFLLMNAGIY